MQPRRPRKILLVLTALVGVALALSMVSSGFAKLTGSSFESSDGNLAVDGGAGSHDWNGPVDPISCPATAPGSGTNCGLDLVKDKTDNSFGQGAKEDDEAPTVVSGAIPPSKDDLLRFYINQEKANGKDFLYLAWERSNLLGSAHMDFELNQGSTLSANGVTPLRTKGDILIDFDFGGSGVPVLALHRWITGAPNTAADCEASNTLPCWDKAVNLTALGFAEAAVNSAPVTDTNPPGAPFTLDGNTKNGVNSTFGEAGINLTDSGIFSQTTCEHFGLASLKSRSSGNSFTSELKDFIAPVPVNISNCGTIVIIKDAVPNNAQDFSYTSNITGHTSFSLDDDSDNTLSNTATFSNVLAGTYSVTEGLVTNWELTSLVCTVSGSGGSTAAQDGTNAYKANITLAVGDTVTCTYTNTLHLGAIKITKTSTKGNTALAGAKFSITSGGNAISGSPFTSDANGIVCVDSLPFGNYVVTETAAPTGYKIDDTTSHTLTVDNNAKCSDSPYVGETISFSDTPLSSIEVKFTSLAGANVTKASIVCANSTPTPIAPVSENGAADPAFDDTDETFTNLVPGTYTCTVVVDP